MAAEPSDAGDCRGDAHCGCLIAGIIIPSPDPPSRLSIDGNDAMRCPQCDAEIADDCVFCPKCGERLRGLGAESFAELRESSSGPPPDPSRNPPPGVASRMTPAEPAVVRAGADPSVRSKTPADAATLWEGRYSLRGMIDAIALAALASVAGVAFAVGRGWGRSGWLGLLCVLAGLWAWLFLLYLVRRLRHRYRLTPETFFHQRGILIKSTSPIEIVRIDDIALNQTILERILNVGTIRILSNDTTDPILVLKGIPDVQKAFATIDQARRAERRRRAVRVDSV